jgi:hypothetical protein
MMANTRSLLSSGKAVPSVRLEDILGEDNPMLRVLVKVLGDISEPWNMDWADTHTKTDGAFSELHIPLRSFFLPSITPS